MAPFVMGRTWVCAQGVAFLDVAVSIQKSVADGLAYFRAPGGESPSIGEDVERSLESGEKSGSDVALRVHRNIPGPHRLCFRKLRHGQAPCGAWVQSPPAGGRATGYWRDGLVK